MNATFRIQRYDPEKDEKPHYQTFQVEVDETDRVLDGLDRIKWYQDGSLTYRRSCAHGICGSDAMRINGAQALACKVLMKEVGDKLTIEPMLGFGIIKDLVVDMEPFFEAYRSIPPYLINDEPTPDGRERRQSPEERHRYDDTTKCILCGSCTGSCPSYWANDKYVGPATIVNAHRFIFDSRDRAYSERLDVMNEKSGVWRCRTIFNCTDACPRGIEVTRAIGEVKEEILFNRTKP
jgi:succinate dehydrogenase / fumarate reductase iron-sulfur subunit